MVDTELYHFGVKGMKWGVRRYQNKDGSLTTAGKQRELKKTYKAERKAATNRAGRKAAKTRYQQGVEDTYNKNYDPVVRMLDRRNIGKKGVNRVNDRMNRGESHRKAYTKEHVRAMAKGFTITTAMMAATAVANATVSSISKYANTKAMQRANSGLARIGTFQYEKVAGNIYRQVMK